jgi:hypothetical protein
MEELSNQYFLDLIEGEGHQIEGLYVDFHIDVISVGGSAPDQETIDAVISLLESHDGINSVHNQLAVVGEETYSEDSEAE